MMRHGEAENNVQRVLAGRDLEYHLTERGKKQVSSTSNALSSIPIDAIYTSPIARTIETARIVSETIGVDYQVDERLTETDMGSVVGMRYNDALEKYGNIFLGFYRDDPIMDELGIERFSVIRKRVNSMLEYVGERHPDTNVLLVTHLDPVKAAVTRIFDLKPQSLFDMSIRNASLTILRHGSSDYSLAAFNVMDLSRYFLEQ
jgi:probable phosphoglycerate mutase